MSENGQELELQALERQLDDAFETTRPRPGFEDELWLRMQSARPAPRPGAGERRLQLALELVQPGVVRLAHDLDSDRAALSDRRAR